MYFEYKYLIKDYIKTIRKEEFLFEWFFPFIIGLAVFLSLCFWERKDIPNIESALITLLGILIGFSIAMLTIITTSSNSNLDKIKSIKSNIKEKEDEYFSLYRLLVVNIGYSVIAEIFLLILNILIPTLCNGLNRITFSIDIFLITHVLLINIRTVTNFYFIVSKDK